MRASDKDTATKFGTTQITHTNHLSKDAAKDRHGGSDASVDTFTPPSQNGSIDRLQPPSYSTRHTSQQSKTLPQKELAILAQLEELAGTISAVSVQSEPSVPSVNTTATYTTVKPPNTNAWLQETLAQYAEKQHAMLAQYAEKQHTMMCTHMHTMYQLLQISHDQCVILKDRHESVREQLVEECANLKEARNGYEDELGELRQHHTTLISDHDTLSTEHDQLHNVHQKTVYMNRMAALVAWIGVAGLLACMYCTNSVPATVWCDDELEELNGWANATIANLTNRIL